MRAISAGAGAIGGRRLDDDAWGVPCKHLARLKVAVFVRHFLRSLSPCSMYLVLELLHEQGFEKAAIGAGLLAK